METSSEKTLRPRGTRGRFVLPVFLETPADPDSNDSVSGLRDSHGPVREWRALARDLGEGGMSLEVGERLETGSRLLCSFALPEDPARRIVARATVVWSAPTERGATIGLRFDEISDPDRLRVHEHLAQERAREGVARLRIEGVRHVLCTRVEGSDDRGVTLGAELPFFRVGSTVSVAPPAPGEGHAPPRLGRIVSVNVPPCDGGEVPKIRIGIVYDDANDAAATATPEL